MYLFKLFYVIFIVVLTSSSTIFIENFAYAQKTHIVYFEDSEHELHVYKIFGKEPGKTIMLIGGIQGDEPGGFLSADMYADLTLEKGNLIVVPRANFQSIVLNKRQINEDMNRKFAEGEAKNYEAKVVTILKKLISQSDCLLNLHDGSGFFSETWDGPQRNPKKYGQSIISDSEVYKNPETGEILELGRMARDVAKKINIKIKNPAHKFHFNNHRTSEISSLHREQKKSATFYAMSKCNIPAFGIESSKSLPLEIKVRHHIFAINAFLELMDIIPEMPGVHLQSPEMHYLLISVNNSLPIAVKNGHTLYVNQGDTVAVHHVEANYERGLNVDILGLGTVNDMRKNIVITKPVRVVAKKDYYPCGSVYIAFGTPAETARLEAIVKKKTDQISPFLLYRVTVNGKEQIIENYQHIKLVKGDILEIIDVIFSMGDPSALEVNFKGFVGDRVNNTGEDRGYLINTGTDLIKRFSLNKKGIKYQIITQYQNRIVGKFFINLEEPVLKYLLIKKGDGQINAYKPGETIIVENDNKILQIVDFITNVDNVSNVDMLLVSSDGSFRKLDINKKINKKINILIDATTMISSTPYRIELKRGKLIMGIVLISIGEKL
ncbi:MAG: hypothetical protein B6I31_01935 [Desulfobacteraceae bacterium 4572_19]|nr:MAG: hypothetical protein B6I31_01935 [Desulfobacteraceae bacterium 4572_19]